MVSFCDDDYEITGLLMIVYLLKPFANNVKKHRCVFDFYWNRKQLLDFHKYYIL